MTAQLAPTPVFRGVDAFGFPLYLGQLGTFVAGTNTPQVTYKDSLGIATNTNPVILNPRGECNLWLDPAKAYKLVLSDQFGNLIWTVDNVTIGNANPSYSIVPTVDNLFTLGSPTFSFANLYLGANHAPVLDTVSGNVGYYARTSAEIAAAVTPTSFFYAVDPAYNIKRYGASLANTSAQNLTALNVAITVAQASSGAAAKNGVCIIIPPDCHYGYNFLNQSTWPQINSGTVPILVIDYSQGDTYDNYPTRYDGTQVREFIYTPQTSPTLGNHNGNGKVLYGSWNPYYYICNTEVNANPTVNATDNLRASLVFGFGTNYGPWKIGQGTLSGAGLIPSQLINFNIQMSAVPQVVAVGAGYSAGATSGVLAAPWAAATQRMATQFTNAPNNDIRGVLFTNGSTSITWTTPLTANSSGDGHLTVGIVAGGGGNSLIIDYAAAGNWYVNTGTNTSTANYHFKQPVTDFNVAMWESLTTVCDHVLRNSTGSAADWIVRNNNGTYELVFPAISATPLLAISGSAKTTQISGAFYPATPVGGPQTNSSMYGGTGAPSNSNGNNGDYYFRSDTPGTANQRVYVKSAGAWVGIV